MALFPSGGAAVKGRVLASFPSTVEGTGGIAVSKSNGVWTIEPAWDDLSVETTLADASARQLWIYNPDTDVYTRLSVQYLLDNLPEGPSGDDGSLIYEQTTAPATDKPANSLWIDSDSADLDVYQLVAGVWTDTGINLKGTAGATGASYAGTSVSSQAIGNSGTKTFTTQAGLAYQVGTRIRAADASSPTANWMEGVVTSYSSTTLAFTADKSLGSGTLTDWTLNVAGQYGADGAGTGDFSSNTATSVDSEIVLFSSTTGKIGKRATTTGILKGTSGVLSAASAGTDYVAPSGALGTPSSGTLTNCTGLPVAGITASTSTALGVGSLELGHASANTLTASSGVLSIEGTAILKAGKQTIFIPASAMTSRTTNGAAAGTAEMATNKNMFKTLDFDTTTQEFAQFEVWFPKSWDLGTVTFQPIVSHASGSGNVVFGLAGVARSDDDAGDVAFGTAQTSDKTVGTANDIYLGPESSAITIAGSPAAGDTVQFQINRTVASDNLGVDARLHGIRLFFTTNAATDV